MLRLKTVSPPTHTLIWASLTFNSSSPVLHAHTFACCNPQQPFLNSVERRMTVELNYLIINLHDGMGPGLD